jgi:outer membrane protein OmpU
MNNFKKIGLTALAASLVSTSAFAGELTATGSASITVENFSGEQIDTGKAFSMADSVVLSGSTELDNGLTVSMSFELDEGDVGDGSYDDHSVTIASDALGTVKFSANGGSSAVSAMDATAAGDIFDNFDAQTLNASAVAETSTAAGNAAMLTSPGGNNSIFYTAPAIMDGLAITASYNPKAADAESNSAFGLAFTGVEGLTVNYAIGTDDAAPGTANNADVTSMKASYVVGPVTLAVSDHSYDSATATRDQDTRSYSVAYTVSDSISVSYGTEELSTGEASTVDAEYTQISASYTSGGMTITATQQEAENISYGTGSTEDQDYWGLTLAFAF